MLTIAIGAVAGSAIALILVSEHQLKYWKNTRALFERAIQVDPHDFIAQNNLGVTYKNLGRFDLAVSSLQAAIIGNPTAGNPKVAMGDLFVAMGKPLASLPFYFSALHTADRTRHFAHNNLAFALCELGRIDEAIQHYNEALQIKPSYQAAKINLAEIYTKAKDPRFRDGRKAVALALELCDATYHSVPEFLETLAGAYAESGQFDKAIETARRAFAKARHNSTLKSRIDQELRLYYEHKTLQAANDAEKRNSSDATGQDLSSAVAE